VIRAAALAGALLLAAPAVAQTAPDAARLEAAREVMRASDVHSQMRQMGPKLAESIGAQVKQMFGDSGMPAGLQTRLTALLQAHIASMDALFTPALMDRFAQTYARNFTLPELQRLVVLMRDPVMVKFRDRNPDMTAEIMPEIFKAVQPRQRELQEQIMKIIANWIEQHPNDRAKMRPPSVS
jgi:uncharacterized protein